MTHMFFFKELVGSPLSPNAYVAVEKPDARQFFPFYKRLDLFAQLLKRFFLYLSSDNTTRFCPFYFRRVFLIAIFFFFW